MLRPPPSRCRCPPPAALTSPVHLAHARPRHRVAGHRVRSLALAPLLAVLAKQPRLALAVAPLAHPAGAALALARLRIAGARIVAVALLCAVLAERAQLARPVAPVALPAARAEALARLRAALGAVVALAALRAVLTVGAVRAGRLAAVAAKAGRARALAFGGGGGVCVRATMSEPKTVRNIPNQQREQQYHQSDCTAPHSCTRTACRTPRRT